MTNVRTILKPVPPPILYHYTTATGLLGIIESQDIWASHTQYLNDQREFKHATEIIKEEIASMKTSPEHAEHADMLDQMAAVLKNTESMNVCVCSFSEEADMLSQWRAYGGGSGFSIGFAGEFLKAVCEENKFWLVKCIYDEAEQRAWMQTLLTDVLEENTQRELDGDEGFKIPGGNLVAYVNRYAPILKHKSFAEEKEWRIISRPLSCTGQRFGFRTSASMLIPFYKIPLATSSKPFQVETVIVGPTPHLSQSQDSVSSLLVRHNLDKTKVGNTAAPFRNW